MKRLSLLLLLLTLNCTHYFVRDSSQYDLTKDELEFLKSKKIGLIGFYPFESHTKDVGFSGQIDPKDIKIENQQHLKIIRFVNNNIEKKEVLSEFKNSFIWYTWGSQYGGGGKITAFFNHDNRTIPLLEFGIDLPMLEGKDENKTIDENNLKKFLSDYLSKTKHLGLDILDPMFAISKTNPSKKETLRMKNFDMDCRVVAYHGPGTGSSKLGLSVLTTFPFIITLGILPFVINRETESTFLVFDKNLNLIKKFEYQDEFYSFTSWFAFGGEVNGYGIRQGAPSPIIYKPDIKQFSKELVQVLKK